MILKKAFICALVLCAGVSTLKAQTDPKAKAILDGVSKKYRSFSAIKSDFTYVLDNPQENIKSYKQSGTIIANPKSNKFRVTIYDGSGSQKTISQEIISDGKTQWTYSRKDNEVQVNDADNNPQSLNPAQIFTIYEKGYKYLFTGEVKQQGIIYQQIDLTPMDSKKPFFKIKLQVNKAKSLIYSAAIFDKNGNKYTYILSSAATDYKGPDAIFGFNKKNYPGVEVVDLR
ncbi:LolA family protein [Mucilaginibacter arboris]|uniref:Outer membrane lipoprotein carrier protein LolA n=1 Tax=Mucilaginibacter arboris TaxID=2682090 RepID=A0A7K1SXF1_9SPHI|nr:outer membrane lipoprotein carrier protein LolA [Mucilaginibacter arboris]MVN22011.1 outer membrane lipoprotein carrier protein LolA [Mucilaginibacter arboris]